MYFSISDSTLFIQLLFHVKSTSINVCYMHTTLYYVFLVGIWHRSPNNPPCFMIMGCFLWNTRGSPLCEYVSVRGRIWLLFACGWDRVIARGSVIALEDFNAQEGDNWGTLSGMIGREDQHELNQCSALIVYFGAGQWPYQTPCLSTGRFISVLCTRTPWAKDHRFTFWLYHVYSWTSWTLGSDGSDRGGGSCRNKHSVNT